VETLLYKMEKQADMLDSKPPHSFQTVLASAVLWKLATRILPAFKNILLPVTEYLFKAIFVGFKELP